MRETSKLICIVCPRGCTLEVTHDGALVMDVRKGCKRGHEFAEGELSDPRRMVATTVRVRGGRHPLLPVYTAAPFPKARIAELLALLRQLELTAPVQMGAVVLPNALGSGIDVLASRDMTRIETVAEQPPATAA